MSNNDAYFDGLARAYVALYEGRLALGPLKDPPGLGTSSTRSAFYYATQAVGSLESCFAASLPPVDETAPQSEVEVAVRAFGGSIRCLQCGGRMSFMQYLGNSAFSIERLPDGAPPIYDKEPDEPAIYEQTPEGNGPTKESE